MGQITLMGNWKMYKDLSEVEEFLSTFTKELDAQTGVNVQLMVPNVYLTHAAELSKKAAVEIGAQNVFYETEGAYTGEVSPEQLASIGVKNVLIGHSERRQYFGDTDEVVNKKVLASLNAGLNPVVCIGESLDERNAGQTDDVIKAQLTKALENLDAKAIGGLTFGYEPVWAIGTGETAEAGDANAVAQKIRVIIAELADESAAESITILYGGSVKANNLASFLDQSDIDGALVGSASLDAENFLEMVKVAEEYV